MAKKKMERLTMLSSQAERVRKQRANLTEEQRAAIRERDKIRQRIKRTGSATLIPKDERPVKLSEESRAINARKRYEQMRKKENAEKLKKEKEKQKIKSNASAKLKPRPTSKNSSKVLEGVEIKEEKAAAPTPGTKRKATGAKGPKAKKSRKTPKKTLSIKLKINKKNPQKSEASKKSPKKDTNKTSPKKSADDKRKK